MTDTVGCLLQAILATTGRTTFPPAVLFRIVCPKGEAPKQILAFNLADGTRTQGEIAKEAKIDPSNFSGNVGRWINQGVLFRLGAGRTAKLLHIYPLPPEIQKEVTT